jgi:hypothetical protein
MAAQDFIADVATRRKNIPTAEYESVMRKDEDKRRSAARL